MSADASPFPYDGPPALRQPIVNALARVIDPEVALDIVDVGLVYGVTVDAQVLHVRLTMTSAACPAGDLIVEEAQAELAAAVPAALAIRIELVWEPPWTPERLSASARRFMGW